MPNITTTQFHGDFIYKDGVCYEYVGESFGQPTDDNNGIVEFNDCEECFAALDSLSGDALGPSAALLAEPHLSNSIQATFLGDKFPRDLFSKEVHNNDVLSISIDEYKSFISKIKEDATVVFGKIINKEHSVYDQILLNNGSMVKFKYI